MVKSDQGITLETSHNYSESVRRPLKRAKIWLLTGEVPLTYVFFFNAVGLRNSNRKFRRDSVVTFQPDLG